MERLKILSMSSENINLVAFLWRKLKKGNIYEIVNKNECCTADMVTVIIGINISQYDMNERMIL